MSATRTLVRSEETGLSNSTHSSTSSADKYQLDEADEAPILLYKYRGRLQTSSQKDLCAWLDKDESVRVTKKIIPRGTSYIDVKRHDLYFANEKEDFALYPNYDSSLASIKIPSLAYWSRMFFGNYAELYIVSPESSPNSTPEPSRRISPSSTWSSEEEEEGAKPGAA